MAEYAGYVASAPVNYGEITNGLVTNLIAIDQAKREEDKKTQSDFDKYFDDNTKAIKDFGLSKSQTFNDMISSVTQGVKEAKLNAYRTGSKQAVNRFAANASTSINNINAAKDAINEGFGVIEKATLEGQVSEIGNVYADFYVDGMDFRNGAFMVMDDGTIPYVKYDENGKIISTNSFLDPATFTKPYAFLDKKVDYEKDLTSWAASLGTYKDDNGNIAKVSPSLNPAFAKAKETKVEELVSTPRNSARFLSSVAGYRGYKSEAAKKELLAQGIPEDKLIKVELQNGVPQPVLTDGQQKAAKQIAEQQINQRVGYQETAKTPGGDLSESDKKLQAMVLTAGEGWADIIRNGSKSKYAADVMQMAGNLGFENGDFEPIPNPAGGYFGFKVYSKDGRLIREVRSQGDLVDFITYNPEKPIESKANKRIAIDSLKKSGKYVTLTEINNLPAASRGGLSVTEYANWLRSQNYYIADE